MAQAFHTVSDLPESDILLPLPHIIRSHRHHHISPEDAMQVDSTPMHLDPDVPPLPTYLALCVSYPTSAAPLRAAIKERLTDAEGLMSVLEVLDQWVEEWAKREELRDRKRSEAVKEDLPPLEKVSSHEPRSIPYVCTQNNAHSRFSPSSSPRWTRLSSHF